MNNIVNGVWVQLRVMEYVVIHKKIDGTRRTFSGVLGSELVLNCSGDVTKRIFARPPGTSDYQRRAVSCQM